MVDIYSSEYAPSLEERPQKRFPVSAEKRSTLYLGVTSFVGFKLFVDATIVSGHQVESFVYFLLSLGVAMVAGFALIVVLSGREKKVRGPEIDALRVEYSQQYSSVARPC